MCDAPPKNDPRPSVARAMMCRPSVTRWWLAASLVALIVLPSRIAIADEALPWTFSVLEDDDGQPVDWEGAVVRPQWADHLRQRQADERWGARIASRATSTSQANAKPTDESPDERLPAIEITKGPSTPGNDSTRENDSTGRSDIAPGSHDAPSRNATSAEKNDNKESAEETSHDSKNAIVWRPTQFCVRGGPENGEVDYDPAAFGDDPHYDHLPYCAEAEHGIWADKHPLPTQRPWVEWGRGLYRTGRIPPLGQGLARKKRLAQHFLVYGDFRTGAAFFQAAGRDPIIWANRLNLDLDWKLTDTERVHAFTGPLDRNNQFTRVVYDRGNFQFADELDRNFDTCFFEGDLGSILGGFQGKDSAFDLPFTVGLIPLLFQNGLWMEDAFVGAAVTLPARHNSRLDWSNYDLTFFAGIDRLNSPAFGTDDSAAHVYGVHWFLEAYGGYLEVGYAAIDDQTGLGRGYHNIGASFTRRYFQRISNSLRVILNAGQEPVVGPRTADGQLVLLETAFVTAQPNTFVPYVNLFAGFGRPQSVARAAGSGGVLRNTGILFETDGLTGFPFLDDSANNTCGGAAGINWLGANFDHQIILELASVQTFGVAGNRKAVDDQYGVGARYQRPLNNSWLMRLDALYGVLEGQRDLVGFRSELRHKF